MEKNWNEVYQHDFDLHQEPALFLQAQCHRLTRGKALDLAMGTGHNAIFLAHHGYTVDAIDSSATAVEKLRSYVQKESLAINVLHHDLTRYRIAENTYTVILNFYFLERSLFPQIKSGLTQGGMLLFETYTVDQLRLGKPHHPAYLLKPNELLHSFSDLHIIYYHERIDTQEGEGKAIASLLAQKPSLLTT